MDEKKKVQIVFEFDRSEYDAYLFLMKQKKTEEVESIWDEMVKEPVMADCSSLDEDEQTVKLMMISLAILSVENRVKE
jgi:pentatricopeptide repeat protein